MPGFTISTLLSLLALALTFIPGAAGAQDVKMLRIGTGGLLGVYYPVGKALAEGITKAGVAPNLIALAQTSGGSEDNVRALAAGEIEAGLVQADTAHRALKGQGTFAGNVRAAGIRAVASLYPERLQIIARRDAGIRSVNDLRGKAISLDMTGSGTLAVMRVVLEAHGLTESDLSPVYLKPEFSQERLAQGKLHGVCLMAGTPAKAVSDIIGPDFSLVPVKADMAARIAERHPYLVPGLIPAGVYPGVPETETVEVRALLVVREDMDEALVHGLAEAIWSGQTLDLLRQAHVQGRSVQPESALTGLSIPLHEGAKRFYQERGLLPNGSPTP
jgi:TRAP transporter TAXI family solute receptor